MDKYSSILVGASNRAIFSDICEQGGNLSVLLIKLKSWHYSQILRLALN
jgi:hypothetical protein